MLPNSSFYDWRCYGCDQVNEHRVRRCKSCGCPASPTYRDIKIFRAALSGTLEKDLIKRTPRLLGFWSKYQIQVTAIAGTVALALFIIFSPAPSNDKQGNNNTKSSGWSLGDAGVLGDYVGGIAGTIFSLGSVLLLLGTLRNQIVSSKEQNFETRYFELVKLHRENTSEFKVADVEGRKVFVPLFREFQLILKETRLLSQNMAKNLSQRELLHIAYYTFFYGVGPNSSRMLMSSLEGFDPELVAAVNLHFTESNITNRIATEARLDYLPVDGHQSRLGHYYRHLYQTVTYVHGQDISIKKYEFIKTVRAQLTNYEQALLLVNSLTPIGQVWWDEDLILTYGLVKNIPRNFFDPETELDLAPLFGENYFEWQERNDQV